MISSGVPARETVTLQFQVILAHARPPGIREGLVSKDLYLVRELRAHQLKSAVAIFLVLVYT